MYEFIIQSIKIEFKDIALLIMLGIMFPFYELFFHKYPNLDITSKKQKMLYLIIAWATYLGFVLTSFAIIKMLNR